MDMLVPLRTVFVVYHPASYVSRIRMGPCQLQGTVFSLPAYHGRCRGFPVEPWHRRHQCRPAVRPVSDSPDQPRRSDQWPDAPVNHARTSGQETPRDHDLVYGLVGSPRCRRQPNVDPRPQMTPLEVLILPPSEEHRKTLGNLVDWPVKLRRVIVNPSLVKP